MNATTTSPVFEGGPSIDELGELGSIWAIDPAIRFDYCKAAESITRRDWSRAEHTSRSTTWQLGERAYIRARLGMPALSESEAYYDGRPWERCTPAEYNDPRFGLPDGIDYTAWAMHLDLVNRATLTANARASRDHGNAQANALTTCAVCGTTDPTRDTLILERDGIVHRACPECVTAIETIRTERTLAEKVGGRTRRTLAEKWIG